MGYLSCKADSAVITCESYKKAQTVRPPVQLYGYRQLEAATKGFAAESLLGKGSHGTVYRGILENGSLVAIKRPSFGLRILQDDTAVENEIEILSKLHSPRLVNLLGFSHDTKERLLVVEFMPNGTLHDVLHTHSDPPSWPRRVHLALQIAKAILTLHTACPPVIHRDVKSSNVLIDAHWNARLGDFGLALRGHVEDIRLNCTPPAGTIGYLDPGYVTPGNLSTKNDVFSFGILLLEMISGRNAIDVQYSPPSIVDWAMPLIRQGKILELYDPRLPHPKSVDLVRKVAIIAARCVRSSEERRPSMKDVVEGLKHVSRSLPLPIWNGLKKTKKKVAARNSDVSNRSARRTVVGDSPPKVLSMKPVRSIKVSDVVAESHHKVVSRRGSGRNLVDLFNELPEDVRVSSEDSLDQSARVMTLRQAMIVRRTSSTLPMLRGDALPVFGEHHQKFSRNHSTGGTLRKPRLMVQPSRHKPRNQLSGSYVCRRNDSVS